MYRSRAMRMTLKCGSCHVSGLVRSVMYHKNIVYFTVPAIYTQYRPTYNIILLYSSDLNRKLLKLNSQQKQFCLFNI